LKRGIENVEVASGIPSLMMGANLEDIASGIDELMIRQPVGVVAVITPFNFPGMIPLWVPAIRHRVRQHAHLEAVGEDPDDHGPRDGTDSTGGRSNGRRQSRPRRQGCCGRTARPSRGARDLVRRSTPVARYIYSRAAANGKRVQCQGRREESNRRPSGC
jgi:malonate-semialdehyde dehydrogenase (acetylating)/methylmalonate-semialdehyde dehydrogenase